MATQAERSRKHYEANAETMRERSRQWYVDNKEYVGERQRKHREANRESHLDRNKRYYEANKDAYRVNFLFRKYGVTEQSYNEMLMSQGGVCKICGVVPNGRRLDVDHCHGTGRVRGLLCSRCNTALERADSVPGWMEKASSYLEDGSNGTSI